MPQPKDRWPLLQTKYLRSPWGQWKVLVTCQCLNLTTWRQVEPVLDELFRYWPSPESLTKECTVTGLCHMCEVLRPLGLVNTRMDRLKDMSKQFFDTWMQFGPDWEKYPVWQFRGCGAYTHDAWTLFVLKHECRPTDKRLLFYAREVGLWKK